MHGIYCVGSRAEAVFFTVTVRYCAYAHTRTRYVSDTAARRPNITIVLTAENAEHEDGNLTTYGVVHT